MKSRVGHYHDLKYVLQRTGARKYILSIECDGVLIGTETLLGKDDEAAKQMELYLELHQERRRKIWSMATLE